MHPLHNAWDSIGFGSNTHGIFGATLDDPMHFNESGLFDGVTKAFHGCFTEEELKKFEQSTRSLYRNSRSSVRSDYPKSRISKGFTSCTLKTANETVGSLLSVVLTVHDNSVFDMMDDVGKRQQQRYLTFPVTVLPKLSSKKEKKEKTPSSQKVRFSSPLVASDAQLLDRYPSRRNYTCGRIEQPIHPSTTFPAHTSCVACFSGI